MRRSTSRRSSQTNWLGVSESTMTILTFIGMVGIYVGGWYAYQEYQKKMTQLNNSSAGTLLSLLNSGGN